MVPMERIERSTSPLPRECSATELHGRPGPDLDARRTPELCNALFGAGEGNRTLVVSLEGFCSTIELHPPPAKPRQETASCRVWAQPHAAPGPRLPPPPPNLVEGEGFEPSKAWPADLQSAPFDRSGTPPNETCNCGEKTLECQIGLGYHRPRILRHRQACTNAPREQFRERNRLL